jgi:hypothetical protein
MAERVVEASLLLDDFKLARHLGSYYDFASLQIGGGALAIAAELRMGPIKTPL